MAFKYNGKDIIVIAHRGGGQLFFENSFSAFKGVQQLGVDAVECDIQVTADGQLAIMHDSNLKRTTGINRKVSELTSEEIKNIKLLNNENIPMLDDLITEVDILLVIELKSIGTVEPLLKTISQHPEMINRCIFISFYHEALLYLKNKFPSANCAALIAGFPVDPVSMVRNCGCNTISLNYEGIAKEYVDRCHKSSINVSVWTPNTIEDITTSLNAGVDAIASDRPDIVIEILNHKIKKYKD